MTTTGLDQILGAVGLGCFAIALASTVAPFAPFVGDISAFGVLAVTVIHSAIPLVEEIGSDGDSFA
ncbi:hypothetical protein CL689_06210 [Candidatus Saccharibacteria bacterium]|nr:hypothetical protein [Candidatus Saccharibacteria bacterium]|tara:strand:- start:5602 stop:5799 length:198 start_codon:yes stop_codon:yes gene_type:complete